MKNVRRIFQQRAETKWVIYTRMKNCAEHSKEAEKQ